MGQFDMFLYKSLIAASAFIAMMMTATVNASADDSIRLRIYEQKGPRAVSVEVYKKGENDSEKLIRGGSGVLLNDGFILTALHVVEGDNIIVRASIGGATGIKRILSMAAENSLHDVALMRTSSAELSYGGLQDLCMSQQEMFVSEDIFVVGFPRSDLPGAPVSIMGINQGYIDGEANTFFTADISVTFGHSGAPVYNSEGLLMGIVKGEIDTNGSQTGRIFIIPLDIVGQMIPGNAFSKSCKETVAINNKVDKSQILIESTPGRLPEAEKLWNKLQAIGLDSQLIEKNKINSSEAGSSSVRFNNDLPIERVEKLKSVIGEVGLYAKDAQPYTVLPAGKIGANIGANISFK